MRSLIIQTSFLGDMVLTTPLIAYLAERGPVDVVCTPAAAGLLANHPGVRDVIVYDKRKTDRGVRGFLRLAARLRAKRYDAAYHAQGSVRSGALSFMAGIRDRVGFATSAGRWFYTTRVPPIEHAHHAARLLSLGTRAPGAPVSMEQIRPRLYPGLAERSAVDAVLGEGTAHRKDAKGAQRGAQGNDPVRADRSGHEQTLIGLAPGSVWATKRWPYYAELAAAVRARFGDARIVVIGGASDAGLARTIVESAGPHAIDATGRLSLLASAELIGRMAVLVTNDSSPLHLASAMNTPTVAIFGPTVPSFGFGPLAEISKVLGWDELACRPCDRHGPRQCPLGHWRCMRDVSALAVAEAASAFADRKS